VATSGDYRNFFEQDGQRFSHTIDPRTGYPVTHKLASVTVLHASSMVADAWATALMVLGSEQGYKIAEQEQLAAFFIRNGNDSKQPYCGYLTTFDRPVRNVETRILIRCIIMLY
jgi:thiamine biosynthesis lipoprotein